MLAICVVMSQLTIEVTLVAAVTALPFTLNIGSTKIIVFRSCPLYWTRFVRIHLSGSVLVTLEAFTPSSVRFALRIRN